MIYIYIYRRDPANKLLFGGTSSNYLTLVLEHVCCCLIFYLITSNLVNKLKCVYLKYFVSSLCVSPTLPSNPTSTLTLVYLMCSCTYCLWLCSWLILLTGLETSLDFSSFLVLFTSFYIFLQICLSQYWTIFIFFCFKR